MKQQPAEAVYNRLRVTPAEFAKQGYLIVPSYLQNVDCERLLAAVEEYRKTNDVPVVHRPSGKRPLRYAVIDGMRVREHFPQVSLLAGELNKLANSLSEQPLVPLADERVAININITTKGGAYRWHYDRNAVTAILYLNSVDGGETECYPNFRVTMPGGIASVLQRLSDRILQTRRLRKLSGRKIMVSPEAGKLLVMRGNKCLHSVLPVTGDADRVNLIVSLDLPGKTFAVADGLNRYLYESTAAAAGDPNYT